MLEGADHCYRAKPKTKDVSSRPAFESVVGVAAVLAVGVL